MVTKLTPELVELRACPTCHATLVESCRSASGHTLSHPHGDRLVPRLWVCRCCCVVVEPGYRFCPMCRARRDQLSKNESARLRRQRERARDVVQSR